MRIVLASTSPRRRELLSTAGVEFELCTAPIDESWHQGECAEAYIVRMVLEKSSEAAKLIQEESLMIAADTIGVLSDGRILSKPIDQEDAFAMWEKMSDSAHEVWTAVCVSWVLHGKIQHQKHIVCRTQVRFVHLTDEMKKRYWETGEPQDKAGAYAIQGGAMAWVESIQGSYTNVVGLPLAQTLQLLGRVRAVADKSHTFSQ